MRVTMKILKRIKETIKSHRELTRLKKELKEHEELLRYMEKRMIEDGWTWDFSGILPKLVKPTNPDEKDKLVHDKLSKLKGEK